MGNFTFKTVTLFLFFAFLCNLGFSQKSYSSVHGKEFWVGFMDNYNDVPGSESLALYISTNDPCSVSVYLPNYGTLSYFVTPASATKIPIPHSYMVTSTDTIENKGIRISATDTVTVVASNYTKQSFGTTSVLTLDALGADYFVSSWAGDLLSFDSEFLIVAVEDSSTIVYIDNMGVPVDTVILNKGQCYQHKSITQDLSGWQVKSIGTSSNFKKFALFSGSKLTSVGGCGYGEHLYSQQTQIDELSSSFITMPFKTRNSDMFKVVSVYNNTQLYIDGVLAKTLNKGETYKFSTGVSRKVTSSQPVYFAQLSKGGKCDNVLSSDPTMVMLPGLDQMVHQFRFISLPSIVITSYYVNVLIPTSCVGQLMLDNAVVNSNLFSVSAADPNYSYASLVLTSGSHILTSSCGFSAVVYGYGPYEAYAYSSGGVYYDCNSNTSLFSSSVDSACTNSLISFNSASVDSNLTFNWSFGDGMYSTLANPDHAYTIPGIYSVQQLVSINTGGCKNQKSTKDIFITGPTIKNPSIYPVSCKGGANGYASFSVSGGNTYNWQIETDSGNYIVSYGSILQYAIAGNYIFTVTDLKGCTATRFVSITEPQNELSVLISSNQNILTANSSGGTPPYEYTWYFDGIGTTSSISALNNGLYGVFITDSKGCTTTDTIYLSTTSTQYLDNETPLVNITQVSGASNIEIIYKNLIQNSRITMLNVIGETIWTSKVLQGNGSESDLPNTPPGIYFLLIEGTNLPVQRFVKY